MKLDAVFTCCPFCVIGLIACVGIRYLRYWIALQIFVVVPPAERIPASRDLAAVRQYSTGTLGILGNIAAIYRAAVDIEVNGVRICRPLGIVGLRAGRAGSDHCTGLA